MQILTVHNKGISEKRRAEIRGELAQEVIHTSIIENGYLSLTVYQKETLKQEIANSLTKDISLVTEADILEHCKEIKKNYFKITCETTIEAGFTASNGHFYRTNRDDQTNMIGQKDEVTSDPSITTVPWKTEDAGYIVHPIDEWIKVYNEAFVHKKAQLYKYDVLKRAVLTSTSHEELGKIDWKEKAPVIQIPVNEEVIEGETREELLAI